MLVSALALGAAVAVVLWVAMPVVRGEGEVSAEDEVAVALLARREGLLQVLRDLDADRAAGRLSEHDYTDLRASVVGEGVEVLAALDRLGQERAQSTARQLEGIEAEVARRAARAERWGR